VPGLIFSRSVSHTSYFDLKTRVAIPDLGFADRRHGLDPLGLERDRGHHVPHDRLSGVAVGVAAAGGADEAEARCVGAAVAGCNDALLARAVGAKLLRTSRVRRSCRRMCATRRTRGCWPRRSAGWRRRAGGSRPRSPDADPGAGPEPVGGRPRMPSPRGCACGRLRAGTRRRPWCGERSVDDALHEIGVRTVVIPCKGKTGKDRQAAEHMLEFRRTIKWRTGCEGRINTLKRGHGWDRHPPGPQSKEPGPGPETGSWPTTLSRSRPWAANQGIDPQNTTNPAPHPAPAPMPQRWRSSAQALRPTLCCAVLRTPAARSPAAQ
jgi:hypothetical protein